MSILNIWPSDRRILLSCDSAATVPPTSVDGSGQGARLHGGGLPKIFPLPNLGALLAGRGDYMFLLCAWQYAATAQLSSFDEIALALKRVHAAARSATDQLRMQSGHSGNETNGEIALCGYSLRLERMCAVISLWDLASASIQVLPIEEPWLTPSKDDDLAGLSSSTPVPSAEDAVAVMRRQVERFNGVEGCFVGGALCVADLTRGRLQVDTFPESAPRIHVQALSLPCSAAA